MLLNDKCHCDVRKYYLDVLAVLNNLHSQVNSRLQTEIELIYLTIVAGQYL